MSLSFFLEKKKEGQQGPAPFFFWYMTLSFEWDLPAFKDYIPLTSVFSCKTIIFVKFGISRSLLQLVEEVNNLLFNRPSAIFVLTSGGITFDHRKHVQRREAQSQ